MRNNITELRFQLAILRLHSNLQHWGPIQESGIQGTVCLPTVNQERITTWKEVAVLRKQVVASGRVEEF